jgi:SAM-dependent methyltransferase
VDYKYIYYPEAKFGGFTDIDGTIAFYVRVNALLGDRQAVALDIGCGRGLIAEDEVEIRRELKILKGKCRKVTGIDVDEDAAGNPFIDEFHLIKPGGRWPVEDRSIDLAVGDYVLEHVGDPDSFFSECGRVIKPGGHLCLRTPNQLNYITLISMLVPNRLHSKILTSTDKGVPEQDIFPTVYKCNRAGKIRKMMDKYGFQHCVYHYDSEPTYFNFSRFLYMLGAWYQKLSPRTFRSTLFAFGKKL